MSSPHPLAPMSPVSDRTSTAAPGPTTTQDAVEWNTIPRRCLRVRVTNP